MKLISWNVNGIRAWYKKDNTLSWVLKQKPDFFCFQEIKAEEEQLPENLANIPGYFSYFESSKGRKGYSGVAIYSKHKPEKIDYTVGNKKLDQEGRMLALHFGEFVVINCYFPNGGGGPARLKFKLDYYDEFLKYIERLKKKGKKIVFCGDINTAHNEIDLARPKANEKNTGFLPIEREWMDKVLKKGWIDTWRFKYPKKKDKYTYWDMKTRSRDRNVGWRIDYFFVSDNLEKNIKNAKIHDGIYGSDHCPIGLELDI